MKTMTNDGRNCPRLKLSRCMTWVEHLKPFICICDCDVSDTLCVSLAWKWFFLLTRMIPGQQIQFIAECSSNGQNSKTTKRKRRKYKCLCAIKWHWRWRRSMLMAVFLSFGRNMCFITNKLTIHPNDEEPEIMWTRKLKKQHSQDHKIVVMLYIPRVPYRNCSRLQIKRQ